MGLEPTMVYEDYTQKDKSIASFGSSPSPLPPPLVLSQDRLMLSSRKFVVQYQQILKLNYIQTHDFDPNNHNIIFQSWKLVTNKNLLIK